MQNLGQVVRLMREPCYICFGVGLSEDKCENYIIASLAGESAKILSQSEVDDNKWKFLFSPRIDQFIDLVIAKKGKKYDPSASRRF